MDERTVFHPNAAGTVRPGARLNGVFEIERLIAEGGMGEVYKGFVIQSGDPVAIKLMRPEMSRNADSMALFRREASILHNLQHEAIVRYYVFSLDPDLQRAYIAMEFVDGPSLSKRLASGPLPLADVRILLARIGGALEAAHRHGIVHRDISSDNLILPNGDVRNAKIVDFGIARLDRPGEGTIIGGAFAGKTNYVSPEQLGLAGGAVTPKSDIYSFGLVLAEALRGRPIDMGGSQVEIVEKRRRVPDLSDIDPTIRPLLTAMLQPSPDDRPAGMDEVAAWGQAEPRAAAPARSVAAARPAASGGSRVLVAAAVAIAVLGLGVAAYVFRDDVRSRLRAWSPAPATTTVAETRPQATLPPLPPLPPPQSPPQPASAQPAPSVGQPPPQMQAPPPAVGQPGPPTVEALRDELPPRAPEPEFVLPPATIGVPYRNRLPAFADPGGRGLTLRAEPAPPPGFALADLGGGRGEIAGAASSGGRSTFDVIAINHNGKSARMRVTIAIAPPLAQPSPPPAQPTPPTPAQRLVNLEPATVGLAYSAGLPPFRSPSAGLALRAEPAPPEGLTFADLGGGLSQLAGRPARAGDYAFDVVGSTSNGASGRMTVKIEVAPLGPTAPPVQPVTPPVDTATAPPVATTEPKLPAADAVPPPATPQTAAVEPASTATSASAFVGAYDGGPCFAARFAPDDASGRTLLAYGRDKDAFFRFEAAYKRAIGVEPELRASVIVAAECPVADLLRLAPTSAAPPPRIELKSAQVGKGRSLAGTVSGLAGRRLLVLAIDNDGSAHRLNARLAPDGATASFDTPLSGDAASIGPPQMLLAIASDRPIAETEGFRAGAAADILLAVGAQWPQAGASAAAALFKLTD